MGRKKAKRNQNVKGAMAQTPSSGKKYKVYSVLGITCNRGQVSMM